MNTFNQIRHGLTQAWDMLSEGWYEISQRAGQALTRFHPPSRNSEIESFEDRLIRDGSRWGVLAAELSEDDDKLYIKMEVPGMEAEDFELNIIGDRLYVRGEKHMDKESRRGKFLVMERAYGRFERAIMLPSHVDENQVEARYRRGILEITLHKITAARRKKIKVTHNDLTGGATG